MNDTKEKQIKFATISEILKNSFRVTKIVWQERKGLIVFLVFIFCLTSVAPFLRSGVQGLLIDELVKIAGSHALTSYLVGILMVYALALIIPMTLTTISRYFEKVFALFIEEKFELLVLKKKGKIDIATHESPEYNDLSNQISETGIFRIRSFLMRQFNILSNVLELVMAASIIIFVEWWLFLIIFIGLIPEFIVQARYGRAVWSIYSIRGERRRRFWDLHGRFSRLSSLFEIKIYQNLQYFWGMIKELLHNFLEEERRNERKKLFQQLVSYSLAQIVLVLPIAWFVRGVIDGEISIGFFTFLISSLFALRQALSGLFINLGEYYGDSLFVGDIFKLLDIKPVIKKAEKGIILDSYKTLEIAFENITFSYPGTKKKVLENFSLKISPGEKVALIGLNGAGKTTLVKLLCRFYDPDEGRILVGGHDLKNIDLGSWYHRLGIIFQDYSRYHFLVKEAIAIGRTGEESDIEKIKAAAKASEADIFIEEWENSYDQMLGKEFTGGVEPSIGQWQKLALARTFYRDPRILILDEPTASLDAESEAKIFERIESLPDDRTVILISHRFSTVRKANKIVVIENGRINESGNHEDLLALNGTYARLFNYQAQGYK